MSLCSWPMKVLVVLILISNLYDKHDCIGNIMSSSYDMESVVCSHFSTAFRREPTWIASSLLWTYLIWMSLCPWPMIVLVVLILILYLYNKHDCIGNIMSSSYDDKESVVCSSLCLGGFWWWWGVISIVTGFELTKIAPKIAGSNPVRAFFFSNFFLFSIRTVFFLLFFPLLSEKNPMIFNILFRNFIQCRPKKWKKKKENPKKKKNLSKTPIFKSELIILKRAIDLTFCQTP